MHEPTGDGEILQISCLPRCLLLMFFSLLRQFNYSVSALSYILRCQDISLPYASHPLLQGDVAFAASIHDRICPSTYWPALPQ